MGLGLVGLRERLLLEGLKSLVRLLLLFLLMHFAIISVSLFKSFKVAMVRRDFSLLSKKSITYYYTGTKGLSHEWNN